MYLETEEKGISTSDRMLKIAKKYVYWVTQGKSADDIYLSEKISWNMKSILLGRVGSIIESV